MLEKLIMESLQYYISRFQVKFMAKFLLQMMLTNSFIEH